jgi:hypothetical protein
VAITGGVVAIIYRADPPKALEPLQRIPLTVAVTAVAIDALVCSRADSLEPGISCVEMGRVSVWLTRHVRFAIESPA